MASREGILLSSFAYPIVFDVTSERTQLSSISLNILDRPSKWNS